MAKETLLCVYMDFGDLCCDALVDVYAEWDGGQVGSVEEGKKMEPDHSAGWVIHRVECDMVPDLDKLFREDDRFQEKVYDAVKEQC